MRIVVYVVPLPGENSFRFIDALRGLENVRLFGICQHRPGGYDHNVFTRFAYLHQVDDCFNVDQLEAVVRKIEAEHGKIHRLVAALEQLQQQVSEVRARCGIEGMQPDATERFTDKSTMKHALREAGLPCAKHALLTSLPQAATFVKEVGFPIILKPPVGAGCKETYLIENDVQLDEALHEIQPSGDRPLQAEEFIRGQEHSFETITVKGEVRMTSLTHYLPPVLEVVRNPWIKYAIVAPREIEGPKYADIQKLGPKVVKALGMTSGYTHMEWFRRADGSLVIGEIAARPPGVQIVPMMGYMYGKSFYQVWARAVVDDAFDGPWERKSACGVAFLRGPGEGRVSHVTGLEEVYRRVGEHIVEAQIPQIGTPKNESYEGEGYIIVQHHDTAVVEKAIKEIVTNIDVQYRR